MGMDEPHPLLSWKLHDGTYGARQTAYQVLVASSSSSLSEGKPDVWDSGRVESDRSVGVPYAGPALAAEKRYFWQVKVWGQDGKAYPTSAVSWWETGLLNSGGWRGKWIGYEEEEHRRLREANAEWVTNPGEENYKPAGDTHHNFRYTFEIAKPVKRADLFVAGEDTPAAWVNGQQVLQAQPLPPWKQSPWKTYTRKDVTQQLRTGKNLLAVDVTLYAKERQRPGTNPSRTPMNATLYVEMSDGSVQIFKTGSEGWKSALDTKGDVADCAVRRFGLESAGELQAALVSFWRLGTGEALAHRSGEVTAQYLRGVQTYRFGPTVCHGLGRLPVFHQRTGSRRPSACARMDGLPAACALPGLRRNQANQLRQERDRSILGSGVVYHAAAVVPARLQLRRYAARTSRTASNRTY